MGRACASSFHIKAAGGWGFAVASFDGPKPVGPATAEVYARIVREFRGRRLETVHERAFGTIAHEAEFRAARAAALEAEGVAGDTPVTYVEGRPTWGAGLAGVIVAAVGTGPGEEPPRTIRDGGVPCGRSWRRDGTRFVVLQDLQAPREGRGEPAADAAAAIERAARLLGTEGLGLRDVVRTWYYLDRILDWYPEFNAARTAAYGRLGLPARPGGEAPPPASTGISGRTSSGSACTLDLIAVAPAAGGPVRVEMLANPAQADPWRYGSSFSRGAVVRWPGAALVEVSGAAAIDASGASVHRGDVARQAAHTLDAIAALLQRRGGVLPDLAAATAFVKRAEDAAEFRRVLAGRGITDLPAVCVVADVCREELLFELDGEALVPTSR